MPCARKKARTSKSLVLTKSTIISASVYWVHTLARRLCFEFVIDIVTGCITNVLNLYFTRVRAASRHRVGITTSKLLVTNTCVFLIARPYLWLCLNSHSFMSKHVA